LDEEAMEKSRGRSGSRTSTKASGSGRSLGIFYGRQHIERRCVAVWVFPLCQGFCLCPGEAAGDVGDKFEQHIRREPERNVFAEHLVQWLAGRENRAARRLRR
jgi:hypothetical protein